MRRNLPQMLAFSLLMVLQGACLESTDEGVVEEPSSATTQAPLDFAFDGAVTVLDAGHWTRTLGCSGICVQSLNFWVDIAVRNDAFEKQVGILWTDSGWASVHTAFAHYEEGIDGTYERWGIDVEVGQYVQANWPREIEYAVFATMGGQTHWDPYNNYYIFHAVSRDQPIRRLSSEVHIEGGQAVMTGRARVFDLAFEKRVTVRYTTDHWETQADVEATWLENEDWAFRVPNLGAAGDLPEELEYAIRYLVGEEEYWDGNFVHALHPLVTARSTTGDLEIPLSGQVQITVSVQSHLPISAVRTQIDSGPWVSGSARAFNTLDYSNGDHALHVEVGFEDGSHADETLEFSVANAGITPLEDWFPQEDGANLEAESFAIGPEGAYYFARRRWNMDLGLMESAVVVYEDFGDATPSHVFPLANASWLQHITVDADGRAYVTSDNHVMRLTTSGALDSTFGAGGVVNLRENHQGSSFCYTGTLLAGAEHLYVADTCNYRIVRFDDRGVSNDAISVPNSRIPQAFFEDEEGLWVLQSEQVLLFSDSATDPLELVATYPITGVHAPRLAEGLARTADGHFWIGEDYGGALLNLDDNLEERAYWVGDNGDYTQAALGSFHMPEGLQVDAAGDLILLAAPTKVLRFAGTLD